MAERTLAEAVRAIAARLAGAGIEDARREAWLLLAHATGRERADLLVRAGEALPAEPARRLEALARRRAAREPMAYILGGREFWSLPFVVRPGVLIPRPESETVVEAALADLADRKAPLRVLDLGTGSGCLLLVLLSELPDARGLGVDTSAAALAVAAENARRLGLAGRAAFRAGDWGAGLEDTFDLVVSNPPYIADAAFVGLMPEVRDYEPADALRAGADGLAAYRSLAPQLARLLAAGGRAYLEVGEGQAGVVAGILAACGLGTVAVRRDLAGIGRCLVAHRICTGFRQEQSSA